MLAMKIMNIKQTKMPLNETKSIHASHHAQKIKPWRDSGVVLWVSIFRNTPKMQSWFIRDLTMRLWFRDGLD